MWSSGKAFFHSMCTNRKCVLKIMFSLEIYTTIHYVLSSELYFQYHIIVQ